MTATRITTADGLSLAVSTRSAGEHSHGSVLLAHGITQDMDEGGMFVRLTDCLTDAGFDVLRFSYRGHGESDGRPAGVTVGGELLDFERAFEELRARFDPPHFVVAKSFGAVSTSCSLPRYQDDIAGVVFWNPAVDLEGTFLEPKAAWGRDWFTGAELATLRERGSLRIAPEFEMGRVLYEELSRYDPAARFRESDVPALVVHGTADEIVPYEDARRVAREKGADFHTVEGGDHGFVKPDEGPVDPDAPREQDRRTVAWLRERAGADG